MSESIYHIPSHHDHHYWTVSEEELEAYRQRQQAAAAQPVKQEEAEYVSYSYHEEDGTPVYVDARQAYPMMLDGFSI